MTLVSYRPASLDLALYGGDEFSVRFEFKDRVTGDPVPLEGTFKAQIRKGSKEEAEFTVDLTEAITGIIRITLTGEQTADLAKVAPCQHASTSTICEDCLVWDLEQTKDGAARTWYRGAVSALADVTR